MLFVAKWSSIIVYTSVFLYLIPQFFILLSCNLMYTFLVLIIIVLWLLIFYNLMKRIAMAFSLTFLNSVFQKRSIMSHHRGLVAYGCCLPYMDFLKWWMDSILLGSVLVS